MERNRKESDFTNVALQTRCYELDSACVYRSKTENRKTLDAFLRDHLQQCNISNTTNNPHFLKGKHCCQAPGIKTPKIYHRKCPPQMKTIHISKCKPSGGGTDEDEDADEDDPIPLRHNTVSDDECPTGLCLESKPTCTRSGGKVVQVKPRVKTPRILQCDAVVCKNAKCQKKTLFVLQAYV